MMEKCFLTDLTCKGVACEGIYHEATQQCKLVMAINRYVGRIDGPAKTETKQAPTQQPVHEAMKSDNPFPELVPGKFCPSIAGRVTTPIEISEVQAQGKPTPIAKFTITDGAIVVPVAVWEPGDSLDGFNVGSWITLTKMSVREYQGETQISSTRNTKISR